MRIQNSEFRAVRRKKYSLIFPSLSTQNSNFFSFLDRKPYTFFDSKNPQIFTDKGFDS
ncbi:MAG: hypothetical protein F6K17_06730 [Okeania sp. SIO3C4]|nr:hypothetical protein [Okeania sp. SIO3C4]